MGTVTARLGAEDAEGTEKDRDIRTAQEPLGHKDVKTTMICTHALNKGGLGVTSPVDVL